MRDGNRADPDGKGGEEDLGGPDGGETIFRIYLMREEGEKPTFNRRKNS